MYTAAAFELEKNIKGSPNGEHKPLQAGKQLAGRPIVSRLPQLLHMDHEVILRPKEGLQLTTFALVCVAATIRLAANVHWERGKEKDKVGLNKIQGTIRYSTPKKEDALKVFALNKLQFGSKVYEVTTHMAAPEDCGTAWCTALTYASSKRNCRWASLIQRTSLFSECVGWVHRSR
ncbi:hypothetical protein HPB48_002869 [Haemaphysalis longicornis]|uniref:Ig-like domain-containing protein n=1 Tax=Haemaphysalis longicornis TaxID=44386 RepID=A0A9J6FYZ9_HAELO|nr:hypothetical protein HPB48_002869 [Haemaphysalis longicornis]